MRMNIQVADRNIAQFKWLSDILASELCRRKQAHVLSQTIRQQILFITDPSHSPLPPCHQTGVPLCNSTRNILKQDELFLTCKERQKLLVYLQFNFKFCNHKTVQHKSVQILYLCNEEDGHIYIWLLWFCAALLWFDFLKMVPCKAKHVGDCNTRL
jgi:hypothetical protein